MSTIGLTRDNDLSVTTTPRQPRSALITLRNIAIAFSLVALVVTGYMSYQKFAGEQLQCTLSGVFNCAVVENSAWSQVVFTSSIVIPTAFLGFLCHTLLLVLHLLEKRFGILRQYNHIFIFGITLFAFMYHCYLTFVIAIGTLRALCQYCLIAHFIMTMLLIIASIRLLRTLKADSQNAVLPA